MKGKIKVYILKEVNSFYGDSETIIGITSSPVVAQTFEKLGESRRAVSHEVEEWELNELAVDKRTKFGQWFTQHSVWGD